MRRKSALFSTTAAAFATAALVASPAAAQQQAGEEEAIDVVTWAQADDFYQDAWTAEQLFDTEVYGENGEEAGEAENLLIGEDGQIRGLIVESGGFLDIGDTHYMVPWEQVEMTPALERIVVPVTSENIEEYTVFPEDAEEAEIPGFRASELMGDYVSLSDYPQYGMVQDLLFKNDELTAVVVYPDVGYGVYGPYAYPWYGYDYGFEPGADVYGLPYARADIEELGPFDYEALEGRVPGYAGVGEEGILDEEEGLVGEEEGLVEEEEEDVEG